MLDRDIKDVGFDTTVCFYLNRGGLLWVWTVGFTGCVMERVSYTMQAVDRDRDVGFDTAVVFI